MGKWWKEVERNGGERTTGVVTTWREDQRPVQVCGPVVGLLIPGSREQAVERMLDSEIADMNAWLSTPDAEGEPPMTAEDEAEWRLRWRPEMERRLDAALGEQEG